MKRAFDLTLAAEHLAANPKAEGFIKAVRRFQSLASVILDLKEAQLSINALHEVRNLTNQRPEFARALLFHAVIVYCRATHTQAIERYNVGATGGYNAAQREQHKEITKLRDKVLAHFGSGDGWHVERVVYIEQETGNYITSVHQRVTLDTETALVLHDLLAVAVPYVIAKQPARTAEIDQELAKAPELYKLIDATPFDVQRSYGELPNGLEDFYGPTGFTSNRSIITPKADVTDTTPSKATDES